MMMEKIEKLFLPLANKLSANRYLSAIRDGYMAILSILIAGSFFILINNVIIGEKGLTNKLFGQTFSSLQDIGNCIIPATMSIMAILLTFTIAKALCEHYKEDTSIIPSIAVVVLFILMPITFDKGLNIEYINTFYTGSAAMFMAFIASILTVEIIRLLSKIKAITIKMPDSVPPSIAKSFNKLIPIIITLIIFGVIRLITNSLGSTLNDIIFKVIQQPFTGLVTSIYGLVIIYIIYMLVWGLGIHSAFIFGAILEPIYLTAITENMNAIQAGGAMNSIITKPFVDSFVFMGGAGNMLALIIAIFIASRREDYRAICKVGLTPALFNISEPIMFGLPVVMNPILIIPMIITTLMGLGAGIFATSIGFIQHTYVLIPWTTPPILSAFFATGGDFKAAIVAAGVFILSVIIYMPFVAITNKQRNEFNG